MVAANEISTYHRIQSCPQESKEDLTAFHMSMSDTMHIARRVNLGVVEDVVIADSDVPASGS